MAARAQPVPSPYPLGAMGVARRSVLRALCRTHEGQEIVAWQPSTRRGQPAERVDRSADCCVDWHTVSSERSEQRAVRPLMLPTDLPSAVGCPQHEAELQAGLMPETARADKAGGTCILSQEDLANGTPRLQALRAGDHPLPPDPLCPAHGH